jgi:DNA-binding NarL/FixJ family response regulator
MTLPPIRLLLADDAEAMRRAIATLLKSESSVTLVGEVCSYTGLLEQLNKVSPDVVLMDIRMPGLREAQSLKDQLGHVCLLAMSFWADDETASIAKGFGAFTLLEKGQLVQTLMPAIQCTRSKNSSRLAQW